MREKRLLCFRDWVHGCLILLFFVLPLGGAGVLLAQDADENEFMLEEIVVTGSRIARNNNESASPIVTVDKKLFENSATMAVETQLNKLPQFTPTAEVPTEGGAIQPTARTTPGSATVALRGIGSNRTLVLINGRRGTPANAMGVVDINSIPAAAVEYVEAISGGASSTYGADAMAGVLNFIMKNHFEGMQVDVQSGITQEGDNLEYQVSGVMGSNFADNRGNISVSFSYNERQEAFQWDRDWYREWQSSPSLKGPYYFSSLYSGFKTGTSNLPDMDVVNSVVDGGTFTSDPNNVNFYVGPDGQVFSGFYQQGVPGAQGADVVDNVNIKMQNDGQLGVMWPGAYLILPLERYNMYSRGNYEINDHLGVFAQGYFSKVSTVTVNQGSPSMGSWGANELDPTINRNSIPKELLEILDSRPDPDAPIMLRMVMPGNRGTETDVTTFNMVAGLEGDIPGLDWTWEVYGSRGEAETTVLMNGLYSLQRIRAILYSGPDFGKGAVLTGNPEGAGYAASTGTCTSGLNPFDWASVTQDCLDATKAETQSKQVMRQTIWEANAQGHIADLPMGEMLGAIGASYRKNEYEFQNDILLTQGTSFIEQALGLYPAANSDGEIEVTEIYAELIVPVLKGLPFFEQFNLELGGRQSDYNTTGTSYTYKAQIDWRTNDWIRIRGGYNRAERSPNIAELYLAPEMTSTSAAGGDVCSMINSQAWSANPEKNPEHWRDVVNICGQLMEATGNEDADDYYYGLDYRQIVAGAAPTAEQFDSIGNYRPNTIGNPKLDPETADTWTMGVVFDSPFAGNKWVSDLRVSVDYYSIYVKDAIGDQSVDLLMRMCTDGTFNTNFDANSPLCAGFGRNPFGNVGELKRTFYNNGRFETSGIDTQITWGMEAGPGRIDLSALFNYLISMESAELDALPMIDYAGTTGPDQNGLNGWSYRWRLLTDVSYTIDDLRLTLRWSHKPSIDNSRIVNGPTDFTGAPSYDLFDLMGSYSVTSNILLRFGMENIFNEEPPLTEVNYGAANGMYGGTFNSRNYDTNGRRFYVGARVSF